MSFCNKKKNTHRLPTRNFTTGFSVIEVLVVVAIISIVAAISYTTFIQAKSSQSLEKDASRVVAAFDRARSLTLSSSQDRQYGVHIESDRVTIFPGSTYSTNDPDNQTEILGPLTSITQYSLSGGGSEVIFDRLTGKTSKPGTITVSLNQDTSRFYTITVLGTGLVEIN